MPADVDPEHDAADFSIGARIPPKLAKFRNTIGIDTPKTLMGGYIIPRPARNIGMYARVVSEERKTNWQYWLMNGIIEASFLGQIAIAACLTALGAADGSHIAITLLGSVNTVVAGVQTYLKGQGMPNRLKQYAFGLRKLREHIEDLERHFSHAECRLNVDHEIEEISAMYHSVRQTAEDNAPETYKPMAGAGARLLHKGVTKEPQKGSGPKAALSADGHNESALAAEGKAPAVDAIAETGGAEAAVPPISDADVKGNLDAQSDGTTKDTDVVPQASSSNESPKGETHPPETHPNAADENEETPLLKK